MVDSRVIIPMLVCNHVRGRGMLLLRHRHPHSSRHSNRGHILPPSLYSILPAPSIVGITRS